MGTCITSSSNNNDLQTMVIQDTNIDKTTISLSPQTALPFEFMSTQTGSCFNVRKNYKAIKLNRPIMNKLLSKRNSSKLLSELLS